LFADEDDSRLKWVWAERLERCAADPRAAALLSQTIGEIA
jgi:hypothetical protein